MRHSTRIGEARTDGAATFEPVTLTYRAGLRRSNLVGGQQREAAYLRTGRLDLRAFEIRRDAGYRAGVLGSSVTATLIVRHRPQRTRTFFVM